MKTKRILAFLLTLVMILGISSVSSFAATNEDIISTVALESDYKTGYKVKLDDHTIELEVPYSLIDSTIDPNAILNIKYVAGVVNPVVTYEKTSVKVTETTTKVKLNIMYGAALTKESTYTVEITAGEASDTDVNMTISLDSTGTAVSKKTITALFGSSKDDVDSIEIIGAPKIVKFKLSGEKEYLQTNSGAEVEYEELDDIVAVPIAKGTQNFAIIAYDEDGDKIDIMPFTVCVKSGSSSATTDTLTDLTYTVEPGAKFSFVAKDINDKFKAATSEDFDYVTFTLPAALYGAINYDSKAITETDEIYRTAATGVKSFSKLVFEPSATYTGTLTINYKAYSEDELSVCSGKINITYKKTVNFKDVKASDYFYESVNWAIGKGITTGTTTTTFSPTKLCTRAEILTFMWRSAGSPEPSAAIKAANKYTDIPSTQYYYKAILWAMEKNIIDTPTKATKFNPDTKITRSDVVTYFYKMAGSPAVSTGSKFTDVKSTASYASAVYWAVEEEITTGTSATKFSPTLNCDRAQIVTLLYRYYN